MAMFALGLMVTLTTGNMATVLESFWQQTALQDMEFTNHTWSVTSSSAVRCAARCARQSGCASFTFDPDSATCRLFPGLVTASTSHSVKPGVTVFWRLHGSCRSPYSGLAGSKLCIRMAADRVRRDHAARVCEAEGAHLVTMETREEQTALWSWLKTLGEGWQTSTFWSGTTAVPGKNVHLQADGGKATFWAPGQPDGQTCAVVYNVSNHDNLCEVDNSFICQIPLL